MRSSAYSLKQSVSCAVEALCERMRAVQTFVATRLWYVKQVIADAHDADRPFCSTVTLRDRQGAAVWCSAGQLMRMTWPVY